VTLPLAGTTTLPSDGTELARLMVTVPMGWLDRLTARSTVPPTSVVVVPATGVRTMFAVSLSALSIATTGIVMLMG
jgi:hypothetical protein